VVFLQSMSDIGKGQADKEKREYEVNDDPQSVNPHSISPLSSWMGKSTWLHCNSLSCILKVREKRLPE